LNKLSIRFKILEFKDHVMSTGTGRPVLALSEESVTSSSLQAFLSHPLATSSDLRLCANVDMLFYKKRITDSMLAFNGVVDERVMAFVRRAALDLENWWKKWDYQLGLHFEENTFHRKALQYSLHYAKVSR
jgi:hypothetical protein